MSNLFDKRLKDLRYMIISGPTTIAGFRDRELAELIIKVLEEDIKNEIEYSVSIISREKD